MKAHSPLLALFALAAIATGTRAQAQAIKPCPEEFPLSALKITAPAGWKGVGPQRLLLTSVDIVVGEAENGQLVGNRRKTRGGYEVEYTEISTGLPVGTGVWLACRYGDLSLAQRLPDNTDRCVVKYTRDAYNNYTIVPMCRIKP